jgi:futalosine hydrolase
MNILLVAATETEGLIIGSMNRISVDGNVFKAGKHNIELLVTGIGGTATAYSLSRYFFLNKRPDLAINIGIAGAYDERIAIGDVVLPVSDCFADSGIEDGDDFRTLFEEGLADSDEFPFTGGRVLNDTAVIEGIMPELRRVGAVTVNKATGSELTKKNIKAKFNPAIETMEGATFFYICKKENVPFMGLRAISNKVELRNRSSWNIPLALSNLSVHLERLLLAI